jgi:hypothetical protein
MRKFYFLALAPFLAVSFIHAQSVAPFTFNVAGGSYDDPGSYYRFEWNLGEMVLIDAFAPPDSSVLVTQGVLQPCTEKIGNSPMTAYFEAFDYRLFPNPTTGKFEVSFFVKENGRMDLKLIDATGRLLEQRTYSYNGCCRIERFDLTGHPNGVYYIVADLKPFLKRSDGHFVIRHSGLKVIKHGN